MRAVRPEIDQRNCFQFVTCERQTNAVNVFIDATVICVWKIVVDHMHDIADIKTTTGHSRGDENGAHAGAESTPGKV
jgi:hypothetical protein